MKDLASDQNYYYDAEGNVTTDATKGVRWLAREGANVLPEHREALKAFQAAGDSKVAQAEGEAEFESEDSKKAKKPAANKKAAPSKNKGVKSK
jgi:hypothetical protein